MQIRVFATTSLDHGDEYDMHLSPFTPPPGRHSKGQAKVFCNLVLGWLCRRPHDATHFAVRGSKPRVLYKGGVFGVGVLAETSPALPAIKRRILREYFMGLELPLPLGFQPLVESKIRTKMGES